MTRANQSLTPAWSDQFTNPSSDALIAALEEESRPIFEKLRAHLSAAHAEDLAWRGIPWRWSLAYTPEGESEPMAFLIPEPERPQLAMPIPVDYLETLAIKKLPRGVREGILLAKPVSGTLWAEWELTSMTLVGELIKFISARAEAMVASA